jgi:HEAT repeat protein
MRISKRILLAAIVVGLVACHGQLQAGDFLIKKEDIPKAIAKLKSGTPQEKIKAAKDLGDRGAVRITDVTGAIEPLKNLLSNDSNNKVRAAAAEALGKIAPEPAETVKLLLKSLMEDKDEDVKIADMFAIARMGPDAKVAVPELQKYAKDKDKKKLSNAAKQAMKNLKMK